MNRETLEKADVLSKHEVCSSEEWLIARSEVRKRPDYHLIALVGVPLIVRCVCLCNSTNCRNHR
jgi:hypothetical protein